MYNSLFPEERYQRAVFAQPLVVSAVVVTGTLLYFFALAFYRLTFHPLAKHPGPIVGRITDWYSVWHIWKGDQHLNLYRIHQVYGNVVRYGPNRISVNTVSGLQNAHGPKANTQKSPGFYNVFRHFFGSDSTLTTIDPTAHARKRRLLSQALSGKMIKAMENHILKHVRTFCDIMDGDSETWAEPSPSGGDAGWGRAVDASTWTSRLTFDVMGDVAFGRTFEVLKEKTNRYILDVLPHGVHGLYLVGHMPGLLKLHLDKVLFRSLVEGTRQYEAFSKAQFDARMKQGEAYETRDIFASLLEAKTADTGESFTQSELVSESSLLIVAGADSIATALAASFFYLVHHPITLATLTHEIRTAFVNLEDVCLGPTLSSCRYLTAVLDEAMRLSPSVGGLMPREILPGGLETDGYTFPAGTVIGTPHYAIHHNEAYYPDPFTFNPSRWIVGAGDALSTEASVRLAQSAFCPFSIGPRGCVGKTMAYAEMKILLARMAWLFDMRLVQGSGLGEGRPGLGWGRDRKNEFQLYDWFAARAEGPMVEFRRSRHRSYSPSRMKTG